MKYYLGHMSISLIMTSQEISVAEEQYYTNIITFLAMFNNQISKLDQKSTHTDSYMVILHLLNWRIRLYNTYYTSY